MNTKQAKTLPVGIVVSRGRAGHEFERGTVLVNRPRTDNGFLVRWDDGQECWIDYRGAKNIFVPGLRGTRV